MSNHEHGGNLECGGNTCDSSIQRLGGQRRKETGERTDRDAEERNTRRRARDYWYPARCSESGRLVWKYFLYATIQLLAISCWAAGRLILPPQTARCRYSSN